MSNKVKGFVKGAFATVVTAADHLFTANPIATSAQNGAMVADAVESKFYDGTVGKVAKAGVAFAYAAADHLFCANPSAVSAQNGVAFANAIESKVRSFKHPNA